jgi:LysM domain/PA14 domain
MSQPSMRRLGALMVVVLLLSAVLVPAAAAAPASSSAASVSQWSGGCPVYYRVVRGDNLTKIAYRYGVTVNQLMSWNNIWNPDRIYIGQVLVIYPWQCTHPAPKPPRPPAPKPPPLPGPCSGGGCPPPPQPANGWMAQYYNTTDFSGPVVFQRLERKPCWNCGWGSPAPGVNADYFSIRWTNTSNAAGGSYRVSIKTDDGARVFVDGVQILNAWQVQAAAGYFVDIWLNPGWHTWTIEYFEETGVAEFCFNAQKL